VILFGKIGSSFSRGEKKIKKPRKPEKNNRKNQTMKKTD
jgi:hypothetical protein